MIHFTQTKLGDLLETIIDYRGKTPKKLKSDWSKHGIKALSAKNIKNGKIVNKSTIRYVDNDLYKKWMKQEVQSDDILMTSEAPLGETYFVRSDEKILLSQRLFAIRASDKKIDPKFLYYFFNSSNGRSELQSRATGTTVGGIRQTALVNVLVSHPDDIQYQAQVSTIISAYDELIGNNEKRIKILEEIAQILYTEWFVNFKFPEHEKVKLMDSKTEFGMIPYGWVVKELGQIAIDNRKSVDPSSIDINTPYVGLEHIPRKTIILSDWGKASDITSSKLLFSKGDILFGKIRPYFHKVVSAPIDGITSSDTIVISAKEEKYLSIILMCVSSDNFVSYSTITSQGTKMPRADWKTLLKYKVLIPEDSLLLEFNALTKNLLSEMNNLILQNTILIETRDMLIPQLVTGKREVKT